MGRFMLLAALVLGCGPSKGNGATDAAPGVPDAYSGPTGTVTGTVWAPGNAPGMVPAGHEFPIFGAVVYLSLGKPAPIPDGVYCDQCVDPPGRAVFTDHAGRFALEDRVPNTYWLVIQKGQFRREQQIVIAPDGMIELPPELTTLPSIHDPDNGMWIPSIALASGLYDDMQDIMGKLGIGDVDGGGKFVASSAAGVFDVYSNGGAIDGVAVGTLGQLVADLSKMLEYHIIFIPCSGDYHTSALYDDQVLRNLHEYVDRGGKLYVTDWSGEWSDNVFPTQVQLRDDVFAEDPIDTPQAAYDPVADTWNTALFGNADDLDDYTSNNAEAVDEDLNLWLDGQIGPTATGGTGTFDADNFVITGAWDHIEALNSVQIGEDDKGFPIIDEPTAFIIGDDGSVGKKPLTVTFEPTGCGRVLYSTYHTTDDTHVGLVPQERVLVYLIMEIGVCKSGPIVD